MVYAAEVEQNGEGLASRRGGERRGCGVLRNGKRLRKRLKRETNPETVFKSDPEPQVEVWCQSFETLPEIGERF
eukprot:2590333-Rhodomonas_salina.2